MDFAAIKTMIYAGSTTAVAVGLFLFFAYVSIWAIKALIGFLQFVTHDTKGKR